MSYCCPQGTETLSLEGQSYSIAIRRNQRCGGSTHSGTALRL